jgi:hypothetical protein
MESVLRDTVTVFTREDITEVPEPAPRPVRREVNKVSFSMKTVRDKRRGFRSDAAARPGSIKPRILKELVAELSPALGTLFQKSIDEGVVPEDWKEANMTPIFKKGKKCCPSTIQGDRSILTLLAIFQ